MMDDMEKAHGAEGGGMRIKVKILVMDDWADEMRDEVSYEKKQQEKILRNNQLG